MTYSRPEEDHEGFSDAVLKPILSRAVKIGEMLGSCLSKIWRHLISPLFFEVSPFSIAFWSFIVPAPVYLRCSLFCIWAASIVIERSGVPVPIISFLYAGICFRKGPDFHREGKPAVYCLNGHVQYAKYGLSHRIGGPAERRSLCGPSRAHAFGHCRNKQAGKLCYEDQYYLFGVRCDREYYDEFVVGSQGIEDEVDEITVACKLYIAVHSRQMLSDTWEEFDEEMEYYLEQSGMGCAWESMRWIGNAL